MSTLWGMFLVCLLVCLSSARHVERNNVLFFQVEGDLDKPEEKQPETNDPRVGNMSCTNPSLFCSKNYTCCNKTGPVPLIACCPFNQGVCCVDGKHCCPQQTKCDVARQHCYRDTGNGRQIITKFTNANVADLSFFESKKGFSWKDVYCSDGQHYCPNGYKCDVSAGTCLKGDRVKAWLSKSPSKAVARNVVCPDRTQCPTANTCCRQRAGNYACCPMPHAVCCSDGVHCCPNGYTCDVFKNTCLRGKEVMAWLSKSPSKAMTPNVGNVVCPGGMDYCPDGNTCCKLSSGQWGCCPLPQAVCCSDGQHCCPNGYKCDGGAGTCSKGDKVMAWLSKSPSKAMTPNVGNVVCPDGTDYCPDGNTCCKLSSGQWGCCPLPQAVCCSDGQHCCPNGYKCDGGAGTCSKGDKVMAWLSKSPSKAMTPNVGNVVCPGGTDYCPNGFTCCKLSSGQWGCCPLPQAVCCSDGQHCCPNGYKCGAGTCSKGDKVMAWLSKSPSKAMTPNVGNVVCPDGTDYCPDGNTCCKLSSGQWGCCPLPQAVCCSDGQHCCPNGYKCDGGAGTCSKGDKVMAWLSKSPSKAMTPNVGNVVCPGGTDYCPNGFTCCKLSSGQWGCCPLSQAVCCSDGQHCCPNGYKCGAGTCSKGDKVMAWLSKSPSKAMTPNVGNVVCPDGTDYCPDGNTCCKLSSGQWGCCPLPQAVCCSDGQHCCPNGYKCDGGAGTCSKGDKVMAWLSKSPSKAMTPNVGNVVCPGGTDYCPNGFTCCKLSSGQWGCCPLPQAVCCSDGQHCCPNGYKCGAGTCSKGDKVMAWLSKSPSKAMTPNVGNVVCPDGTDYCPDGNTCCKLSSGQWGCCPLPQAVCCSDGQHCCPNGYKCDGGAGTCSKGDKVMAWLSKSPSKAMTPNVGNVVCPDGTDYCPDGNTCCKLSSGQWGCCPLPQAVCCSDGQHCCPNGYKCDGGAGTCSKGDKVMAWLSKSPSKAMTPNVGNVVCPGGTDYCPNGFTCCKLSSGQWGCCPLPQAVCCSDGQHCCPNGYKCGAGTCSKGDKVMAWLSKSPSKAMTPNVGNVVCPDGTDYCPDGNTCCKLSSGQWGCCPLPQAVCCSDGQHCCPNGYKCDGGAGTCSKGDKVMAWLSKSPSKAMTPNVGNVVCPGGTDYCPDGNTCCKLSSGQWGCCPLPQAVCCSDGQHCCPNGYKCDGGAGTCSKGDKVMAWLSKSPSKAMTPNVDNVVCPSGTDYCPDGNTCCKLPSGQWGCCPLPQAVCCYDGQHCCPNGYKCDGIRNLCLRGKEVMAWLSKSPSKAMTPNVGNVVCPGGTDYCPDGNTCCKLSSGQWGCCPLPQAVCCSDGQHCCPNGYKCGAGTCSKGDKVMAWLSKSPSKAMTPNVGNVVCPGGTDYCPDGNTCCKLSSGQWGCCPLPQAVCCSDRQHCCPNGYTCDLSAGTCLKGAEVMAWLSKSPSKSFQRNEDW